MIDIEREMLEAVRAQLQEDRGDELKSARLAAYGLVAAFEISRAGRPGTLYLEREDGKWLAEIGSTPFSALAVQEDVDSSGAGTGTWRFADTLHWPAGKPDRDIVAVWFVWDDMATRVHLERPLPLRSNEELAVASGEIVIPVSIAEFTPAA